MPISRLHSLDAVDDLLLYRLGRLTATAGRLVIRLCEGRYGITRREWRLIGHLAVEDGLPPSALAQRAQLDKARTSRSITSLVDKGLVGRHANPSDRRQAVVVLTADGRAIYEEMMPVVRTINRELMSVLSPEDVSALDKLLERLQAQAEVVVTRLAPELPKTLRYQGSQSRVRPFRNPGRGN